MMRHTYLFIFLLSTTALADISKCIISEYNYSGTYFSDSYQSVYSTGEKACQDRHSYDAKKLDSEYMANRKQIADQIDSILANPLCKDVQKPVLKYKEELKKYFEHFQKKTTIRHKLVSLVMDIIDAQRFYAYVAAYRATCMGEENNINSFLDLDSINAISATIETPATQVKKDGEEIQDCSNVEAQGSNDLKEFIISMQKSKDETFNFTYDFYGIPDQIILKNSAGVVLHDSGCIPTMEEVVLNLPIKQLATDKKLIVNIVNNCQHTEKKGMSAWRLGVKCQSKPEAPCQKPVEELIKLIKQEVVFTKQLTDLDVLERQCLKHYDEDILSNLEKDGYIEFDIGLMTNINCDQVPEKEKADCLRDKEIQNSYRIKRHKSGVYETKSSFSLDINNKNSDTEKIFINNFAQNHEILQQVVTKFKSEQESIIPLIIPPPLQSRQPSAIDFDRAVISQCPVKPKVMDSVLKHVSWSYCNVGFRRLGIRFEE